MDQSFVVGTVETTNGKIPQISSNLAWADRWGAFKARWGVERMKYRVEPGLYALGKPDEHSPVLVTANYKMTFDSLRESIQGRDLWVLVIDTLGINVWCAAGKGTFGTGELVKRVESVDLGGIVKHRELILPQLAGPGVSAHRVKRISGFRVVYGPVRARDLPVFLETGLKATPGMRRKTFSIGERLVLIPVELATALKAAVVIVSLFFVVSGLLGEGDFWAAALRRGLPAAWAMLGAILAGAVLTPLLLPWLPGRPFSLKGLWLGLVAVGIHLALRWDVWSNWAGRVEVIAWSLLILAVSAYLAMNFTGASTYTSLSGVRKEMRWALPLEVGAGFAGLVLWFSAFFVN